MAPDERAEEGRPDDAAARARGLLPPPFNTSPEPWELVAQGAESLLYRTTFLTAGTPAALKVRPEKRWRHPLLDKRLTRARILAEARVLVKLSGEGIAAGGGKGGGRKVKPPRNGAKGVGTLKGMVPAVLGLDWESGWLATEWIHGCTVKEGIYRQGAAPASGSAAAADHETALRGLLRRVGALVGRLHAAGVIHGDLTTSNIMLRQPPPVASTATEPAAPAATAATDDEAPDTGAHARDILAHDLVLIDFGLATQSVSDEDRAVDLYVLERAFGSTHPKEEALFGVVLEGYGDAMGKPGRIVLKRLEDVRMRGRKKSMIG